MVRQHKLKINLTNYFHKENFGSFTTFCLLFVCLTLFLFLLNEHFPTEPGSQPCALESTMHLGFLFN